MSTYYIPELPVQLADVLVIPELEFLLNPNIDGRTHVGSVRIHNHKTDDYMFANCKIDVEKAISLVHFARYGKNNPDNVLELIEEEVGVEFIDEYQYAKYHNLSEELLADGTLIEIQFPTP